MSDTNRDSQRQILPYGTWPSALSAEDVAAQSRKLAEPQLCNGAIYWLEARPEEKGRVQIVRRNAEGQLADLLPEGFSARSRVHEYGGGSYLATADAVYFVNNEDQRLFRLPAENQQPLALTPPGNQRYADLHMDQQRQRLLAVCEDHGKDVCNKIVAIPIDGSGAIQVLAEGDDFYSNPRVSPKGDQLCWLAWNHPAMPWDATQLWLGDMDSSGQLSGSRCIAGDANEESIFQPQWSPEGQLFYVSDRNNWWNIYRASPDALNPQAPMPQAMPHPMPQPMPQPVTQLDGEFATPQWTFNMSTYSFLNDRQILATYTQHGRWHLLRIDLDNGHCTPIASPLTEFSGIHCENDCGVLLGASPAQASEIYCYSQGALKHITESPVIMHPTDVSEPQSIQFPTSNNDTAHAFFYAPANARAGGPAGTKPPVIVICHGGPTGATDTSLNLKIQYWTNRGFAVLDVNYRGSTGYGRHYRKALYNQWGVRDVDDVCAAADYVSAQEWVNSRQRIIKGSSAGGYTVLAALTFRNTFNAGVSLYGIGDLELLAQDTHKFEARYLDTLIGPYPEQKSRYQALSPINHVDQLQTPLLVFQGLEDKVVPPNQAEAMVQAVTERNVPVAYVTYANEAHGFRQADTISHMLAAEQYFYQRIFELGQPPAIPIIRIRNLDDQP